MSEANFNRRPVRLVELRQPRCRLRFGSAPCTAVGDPKCYNTRTTCLDTPNYDPTGASIVWRFVDRATYLPDLYSESGENISTNAIPCLVSVQTQPTRINVAAGRDGESPFGVRSTIDVTMEDIAWDDHVGDFYVQDRANPKQGTFWAKWRARNAFTSQMTLTLYEGYAGQPVNEMQKRLFVLEKVDGPDASGSVRLHGVDPLQLADRRRALFPRPTRIILKSAINATTTAISVFTGEANLTDSFGNTGATKFARIGREIISYTGQTLVDALSGEYILTGVVRGALNTTAVNHNANENIQRVGHYVNQAFWLVAYDLLTVHSRVPAQYINLAQWNIEGNTFISTFRATGTVTEPTAVSDILGELCQQGMFSIWWDERTQTIPMLAVRPPRGDPAELSDRDNILPGATLREDPNARFTRVLVYYGRRDPTQALTEVGNYARGQLRGDPDLELPETGGEVRTQIIYARWVVEDGLAIQLASRVLTRYRATPRYLTISLDAKDRAVRVGDILSISTRGVTDSEGNAQPVLWQVISENEIKPGETIVYDCQTYSFIGRFAVYMADGSPTYDMATDDQRKVGGWYANDSGRMSDGSRGYQYQ
jgi:hypothetical protein